MRRVMLGMVYFACKWGNEKEAVRDLLQGAGTASYIQQLRSVHHLAEVVETEEGRFREVVGDVYAGGQGLRASHQIGKVLAIIKENEHLYDMLSDTWILPRSPPLEQQVAGLRLVLATCSCWGYQFPLTEEELLTKVLRWALEGLAVCCATTDAGSDATSAATAAAALSGAPPLSAEAAAAAAAAAVAAAEETALIEARAVYSLGLVAIALTSEEHAEAAIRGPLVAAVSKYLRHATTISAAAGSAASTLPTHLRTSHSSELTAVPIATALAAATATAAVTAAAAAAAAAASAAVTAAADEAGADAADPMDEGGGPPAAVSVAAVAVEGALLFRGFGSGSMCMQSRRLVYCCQIWAEMGEYLEALGPVLHEHGVESAVELLHIAPMDSGLLFDSLGAVCSLLAHRRFAELFVEAGGVAKLLSLPRTLATFQGISMALFGLASIPLAFERVAALPAPQPQQLVEATLGFLTCGSDPGRKNATMFLAATLHFRVILDEFDAQDGIRRLLNTLRAAVRLLRTNGTPPDLRLERQLAFHAAAAVHRYMAAHLTLHLEGLEEAPAAAANGVRRHAASSATDRMLTPGPNHKPLDVSETAIQRATAALLSDTHLAEKFASSRWKALEDFMVS
ncbi:MAG: hypothetical protein WDW38_002823 [Sanguina aurantia]